MTRDYDEEETTTETPTTETTRKPNANGDTPRASRIVRGGWTAVDAVKNADSPFAQRLRVTEEVQLIKFIDDEPYAAWRQHWIERTGQKSFTCLADLDERGCPLCEAGDRPSLRFAFNVALLTPGEASVNKSLEVGPRVIDQLKNFHNTPHTGPLTKHYWAISRTGKGATSATNLQVVRERDLVEWKCEPADEEISVFLKHSAYTADVISIPNRTDLVKIAAEEFGN
ncbi:hypothetical protein UFOVP361_66 [uncultured Caudovirales phage]|uniref:Bacteriophage T4 Gp32 single-stranded DNA-binding domain-containing protein n=1 Tax=uncultured Caudovirales phage TaxID=2100421 RepID=A0A6J7WW75_9CAUD|nr:hypothetical protein UFOVP361_66 [uncultured Caudovirales phage]